VLSSQETRGQSPWARGRGEPSGGETVTFWRDQFHGRDEHASGREAACTADGAARAGIETAARPINGVGDEAFWSGTRIAGALYVLRGNTFIRVSVGGINDEKERIEKSRLLAVAALARLR
jgi:hypothetical protein